MEGDESFYKEIDDMMFEGDMQWKNETLLDLFSDDMTIDI